MKSNSSTTIALRLGRPFRWLCASLLAAAGPFVATSVAQTSHLLEIIENGESPTPIVTYDGAPVTPASSSTLNKDAWTLVLPTGFALNQPGLGILLGEPESALEANEILLGTQPNTLTWTSDEPRPAGLPPIPNTLTIDGAGTFTPPGGSAQTFNVMLVDQLGTQVPDSSSTATLLGLALLGLLGAARIRAARA